MTPAAASSMAGRKTSRGVDQRRSQRSLRDLDEFQGAVLPIQKQSPKTLLEKPRDRTPKVAVHLGAVVQRVPGHKRDIPQPLEEMGRGQECLSLSSGQTGLAEKGVACPAQPADRAQQFQDSPGPRESLLIRVGRCEHQRQQFHIRERVPAGLEESLRRQEFDASIHIH